MTRRRIKFYRAALRSCGFRSESLRVRAGSRRGEKALGRRSPEVVGMKASGAPGRDARAEGLRHLCGPGRALCRCEPLGEAGPCPCPERPSGSRPARIASKRNSVSPGAAWVPPMGSPHPRSVFRAGGLLRRTVRTVFCFPPCGPACEGSPGSDDLGERRPSAVTMW